MSPLKSPYPWFGGKSTMMADVWRRFGDVRNFVDPFMGSLAPLLGRPVPFEGVETVNDADGFICNFWRAVRSDPEAVVRWADWPVNECDLHARHAWLVERRESITAQLEGNPEWFDARVAGWWVWGLCAWIGGGWCSGRGPWQSVVGEDSVRRLVKVGDGKPGVARQLVHLGDAGRGVHRPDTDLSAYFAALSARLRRVRVCCGDWSRVCGPVPTTKHGLTAVFLDPPYSAEAERNMNIYSKECGSVAHEVRMWAIEHGDDPLLRIALCGYDGEHEMPGEWECLEWKAKGGYGSQSDGKARENARRERIWFSPHCLKPSAARQRALFG